jgi:magnesium-transporting ATPase (P-type)
MGKKSSSFDVQNYTKQPFLLSVDEVLLHLATKQDVGLSSARVQQYRQKYGENELEGEGGVRWYSLLIKQISNAMILVDTLYAQVLPTPADASNRSLSSLWLYPMASWITLRVV